MSNPSKSTGSSAGSKTSSPTGSQSGSGSDGTDQQAPPPETHRTFITQAGFISEPKTPSVVQYTTFASNSVLRLSSGDFTIDEPSLMGLKHSSCFIILFHTDNTESHQLMKLFSIVAEQYVGPKYGAINVVLENSVAEAFAQVRMHGSHPYFPFALRGWPIIIVYRKGHPNAVYNGDLEVAPLGDWALTRACDAAYYEPIQTHGGMQGEARIGMQNPEIYGRFGSFNNLRTASVEYQRDKTLRQFNPNLPITATGSASEKQELKDVKEEEAASTGVSLTPEELESSIKSDVFQQSASQLGNAQPGVPIASSEALPSSNPPGVSSPSNPQGAQSPPKR